jgi:protein-tyrosine phosphatase
MKILMVCLGNICRSPLAEGILKSKVEKYGLDWEVDSAGTGDYHIGELPDKRSIAVARRHGIDLTDQRARQFTRKDFEDFDKIFVMDSSNYQNVVSLAQTDADREKVQLILNEVEAGSDRAVPDPYWSKEDGFEAVFQLLDEACEVITQAATLSKK